VRGRETILRGGGGVFFGNDNELATLGFNGIGFSAYNFIPGSALPVSAAQLNFAPSIIPPYTAPAYVFPRHLQLPYTLQWNVSLQQSLGKEQALTLSYIGSAGRRLLQQQYRSVSALNPDFSDVRYLQPGVTSNYQALQVQFQRSVSRGLQALASYTWSHSLDYGSTDASKPSVRGNSDFDVRDNAQIGASWDLPERNDYPAFLGYALKGWGIDGRFSARTAFPITLAGNNLIDPSTGNQYYGNVNVVPGEPIYVHGSQYPGGRAINPQAFVLPVPGDPGNAARNFVRGFGAVQVNAAMRRQFHVTEAVTLQFRAEAFNLTNHPNFGYVDPTLGDPTFGQATMMLNSSLGTVAPQYQQGGPRSMQFSLRVSF
jgi:hypothetical protein